MNLVNQTVFVILIILILLHRKYTGENAISVNKGNRDRKDNVKTLLSRIRWVNSYKNRVNYPLRYMIFSIIIGFLVTIITRPVSSIAFFQIIFIIWVSLIALNKYTNHHADKYAHYYIFDNTRKIQRLLKLKNKKYLTLVENKLPINTLCHHFT